MNPLICVKRGNMMMHLSWDLPEAACCHFVKELDLASLWPVKVLGKDTLGKWYNMVHGKK